jgi:unsaturated rhamnogalacturonyl hydrolase
MKQIFTIFFLIVVAQIQAQKYSQQLANTAMKLWPDSFMLEGDKAPKWRYDQGVILKGIEGIWNATGDGKWFNYIQKSMDFYVQDDGSIKGYRPDEYNIDHINNGKLILLLYRVTGKEKYKKAADLLRSQLTTHPRTSEGGFWHKKIYPSQMWLDGLYMGQPFYAEYAMLFHEDTAFNDIAKQFILMERHARNAKTGLLYHGWDESKEQQWADKRTGLSPNIWGRAMGWYAMAMVDVLDYFPKDHPGRDSIINILNRFAKAVVSVQDAKTGLWYDIVDKKNEPKNYFEASASSMLVYALAKAVRNGYLPASYETYAKKGYEGIIKQFIKSEGGQVNLHGTVSVSGLGGKPYRDGSFEYYMSEPVIVNDPKGMGAFIKAAVEMEMLTKFKTGKGKTVVLDNFYNYEFKQDAKGNVNSFHYTWDDKSNGGFAMLGDIFKTYGFGLKALTDAPTASNLKEADIYLIVDPDTYKETAKPNVIETADANTISAWVKEGGVLVLLGNDAGNANLKSLNTVASKFGIVFNEDNFNLVKDNQFEQGAINVPAGHSIFKSAKKLYVKELATLQVNKPATPILTKDKKNIIAIANYGKGTVFAIGDPWLYNEYVDGRKLPNDFDNYKAAEDLVKWLAKPSPANRQPTTVNRKLSPAHFSPSGDGGSTLNRQQPTSSFNPQASNSIVVDPSGKGNFRSIQAALNSLTDSANLARTVYIRNGIYKEKLYIEKHNIILKGESRGKTIITQAIARDAWRCGHTDDWGVATVNVDGDDITLENLTIINSFGFDWKTDIIIPCASDSTHKKLLTKNSHQMALRTLNGNRLRAINCHFKAFGGDTVSPWDVQNGMFYFKDCIMEGGVDFYCPRGWAWAENCHFISHSGTAAIWHDGSRNPDSKTVLKNCSFEGFDDFNLGRYHRDAQFYLIDCKFPQNMADRDIYLVPTTNNIQWGRRIYYHNSHRQGGDYAWHKDNLNTAQGSPSANDITVDWLFNGRWKPQQNNGSGFTPKAHARLKKKGANNVYGNTLQKEVMPLKNPATNFTTTPIPYYQTEGPAWENDKVGFRIYLDVRNAKDIFGKTTSAMVIDTVGSYGDKYYHHFDERWGMDVLKVGTSLGAGALAMQLKTAAGTDTIIRLGGDAVEQTSYELIKDGPEEAIIRLYYKNWKVLNNTYNLTEDISIKAGNYFYESSVVISGLKGDEKLVTGIVNLKSSQSFTLNDKNTHVLYTHDKQSENNDHLGMAILAKQNDRPLFGEMPKEGPGITNTYFTTLNVKNNQPVVFRFYACWEATDTNFKNKDYFQRFLLNEAAKWNNENKPISKDTRTTKL